MCHIVSSVYDDSLRQPLTAEEKQLKIRLPITPTAKRLGEFQLRALVFGMSKKDTTVNTQPMRYHLTIPTSRVIRGSNVNWSIPNMIPVVSTSCLVPYSVPSGERTKSLFST